MKALERKRTPGIWVAGLIAIAFGLLTLKEGGLTLFGPPQYAAAAGHYVPFVLWFSFHCGFFLKRFVRNISSVQRFSFFRLSQGDCKKLCALCVFVPLR